MEKHEYPMRINKYLALKQYCTRRAADELIVKGRVLINGKRAALGDKVAKTDSIEVRFRPAKLHYYAYNKPRGIITHSPQEEEEAIADTLPLKGVFPLGRLDKDSYGLMVLTDDGRITEALLSPERAHEKEYEVVTRAKLPANFKEKMQSPVDIGGYKTKPCKVNILGDNRFSITLAEGKKHQIRRMCGAFGQNAIELQRTRVMNITLGNLLPGEFRSIEGMELKTFLRELRMRA